MVRVGVLGAGGRMGRAVCQAVREDPDCEVVAAVDPRVAGRPLAEVTGLDGLAGEVSAQIDELAARGAEVAVDFTVASSALANMRWCAHNAVHGVVGTSGIGEEGVASLAAAFDQSRANCVLASNFAIGAVLLMRLAALAAPYMDGVEIVELHHDAKVDAPSGTSLRTAELLEAARRAAGAPAWPDDPTKQVNLPATRGGVGPGGIRLHSVRLPGLLAHQEVIFGARGQTLTLRHDSYDRSSFMPGVLLAVKEVGRRPGLTVGLESLLGF
ncbi:MAG TPA: 4-hydroxy-tetrahydrodipicolinate reductase [Acidimicrobiales bacterium]|nr:4-hydroxy-tetrahydrodipicolinate reductase [Acidimicrobiales bacterium]